MTACIPSWKTRSSRTGRVVDVPVGEGIIGRVIDPLGDALDGKGPVAFSRRSPIERVAPPIMDREPVTVPLQTGIKVIDAELFDVISGFEVLAGK